MVVVEEAESPVREKVVEEDHPVIQAAFLEEYRSKEGALTMADD